VTVTEVEDTLAHLKLCAATSEIQMAKSSLSPEAIRPIFPIPSDLLLPLGRAPYYDDSAFFGREEVLRDIDSVLRPQPNKQQKFLTLHGIGGVGKSKVALAYAKRYESQFDMTMWIQSQTQMSLSQSFTDIAVELDIPGAERNGKGDENRDLVFDWLKKNGKPIIHYRSSREDFAK
jgi:hypothetical protein